eukprot:8437152-Pyramimonas_sp.AAC.1
MFIPEALSLFPKPPKGKLERVRPAKVQGSAGFVIDALGPHAPEHLLQRLRTQGPAASAAGHDPPHPPPPAVLQEAVGDGPNHHVWRWRPEGFWTCLHCQRRSARSRQDPAERRLEG